MSFHPTNISALSAGIALVVTAMAAQAADEPTLPAAGANSGAAFSGGATINNGASFLTEIPAADAVDLVATIKPGSSDIGQMGSLLVVLSIEGLGFFNLLSGGIWVQWDGDPATLAPFKNKVLEAEEKVTILNDLVGADTNLADLDFQAYVGYYTGGNINTISYSATPAAFSIMQPPANTCPINTVAAAGQETFAGKPICIIAGGTAITTDTHLTSNFSYFLNGAVSFGVNDITPKADKIKVTVDAGTTLFAANETPSLFLVDRGAIAYINGTPDAPVIFTTELEEGVEEIDPLTLRGTWGGVIVNGSAGINNQAGTDQGEGGTGEFGGGANPDNTDDSGAFTYMQVRYAGTIITEEDELNSLALQGVGSDTIIDHVHIHNGADDGIEFYGGTVSASNVLVTGIDDDAIDWTLGWNGNLQDVVVKMTTSGDNCIEADNLGSNPTATPRAIPTVTNFTCIGSVGQKSSGHALELKAGTGGLLSNFVIGGSFPQGGEGCILIAGDETFAQSTNGGTDFNDTLTLENSLITPECAADLQESHSGTPPFTTAQWFAAQSGSTAGAADLGGPWGWVNGSNINSVQAQVQSGPFFKARNRIGAVPNETVDFTLGWTYDYENQ